jgi:glycosyltransferase involved in cell wall biosynthesis
MYTDKIKIAVVARGFGHVTGAEKYIQGFLGALAGYHDRFELHVYYTSEEYLGTFPRLNEHAIPMQNRFIWDHIALPLALRREGFDLVIYTKNNRPLIAPFRSLVIMYDLGYFYPDLNAYRPLEMVYMKFMMRYSARRAWGIFTISESTRQDVIRLLSVDADRAVSILGDTTGEFAPVTDPAVLQSVQEKYDLTLPFIFYPTDISPRKNIIRLLDAFDQVSTRIPHHLYLTGARAWNAAEILGRIDANETGRVHRLGKVAVEDMAALYSLADFTVYVSLFEGLGLPVLEAFRSGSPLLASCQTSIPELAGDAAYLVDGRSVDQIAEGLLDLAGDDVLKSRLQEAGFARAKKFSWEKTVALAVNWIFQRW